MLSPTDCETPRRPFLLGVNMAERRAVLFRPRCKMWSCAFCGPVNRALWALRTFNGAEVLSGQGAEIDFLTLTSHEKLDAESSLSVFPLAWKKLSMRARRKSDHFDYLLIPERHKDGRLHVHALETAALGERWWKDNGRECGLGYIAEEEKVKTPAGAALYVVKYVTKTLDTGDWPKGLRRVRTSRSWPKLPDMPTAAGWDWAVLGHKAQLDEVHAKYEAAGFDIRVLGSNEAWRYVSEDVD